MLAREVTLRLSPFCIENTARRARERLVAALLADEAAGPQVELAAELLEEFLRENDFPALRAADPDFAGDRPCLVTLGRGRGRRVEWKKHHQ